MIFGVISVCVRLSILWAPFFSCLLFVVCYLLPLFFVFFSNLAVVFFIYFHFLLLICFVISFYFLIFLYMSFFFFLRIYVFAVTVFHGPSSWFCRFTSLLERARALGLRFALRAPACDTRFAMFLIVSCCNPSCCILRLGFFPSFSFYSGKPVSSLIVWVFPYSLRIWCCYLFSLIYFIFMFALIRNLCFISLIFFYLSCVIFFILSIFLLYQLIWVLSYLNLFFFFSFSYLPIFGLWAFCFLCFPPWADDDGIFFHYIYVVLFFPLLWNVCASLLLLVEYIKFMFFIWSLLFACTLPVSFKCVNSGWSLGLCFL